MKRLSNCNKCRHSNESEKTGEKGTYFCCFNPPIVQALLMSGKFANQLDIQIMSLRPPINDDTIPCSFYEET